MSADPWLRQWNYDLFRVGFRFFPHNKVRDDFCEMLISNPLLSSWIFAFCFYWLWAKDDEQRIRRRQFLAVTVVACLIAGIVTIAVRPWIHWPAPVLRTDFQPLFPMYLWGNGVHNCFPSHSTLIYFTVAVGFWPLNRSLSCGLAAFALLFISFPRVYEGGHYPVDVAFSCILGIAVLLALWRFPHLLKASILSIQGKLSSELFGQVIFFMWVFELGEGFRGVQMLAISAFRAFG